MSGRRVDSFTEEIEELKRKIALLDGDKKAYYENTQWEMQRNRAKIQQLRDENKQLRDKLSRKVAADDEVINNAFKSNGLQTPAELRALSGDMALQKFDQSISELIKQRNSLQHVAQSRRQTSEQLQHLIAQMTEEAATIAATPAGESETAKKLQELENRLDQAVIQCNEVTHIRKVYEAIIEKLQKERLNFDNEVADIERAIAIRRDNLQQLQVMKEEAEQARDKARRMLQHQEEECFENKKKRDKELTEYRREAEEKKEFADRVDRRTQLRRLSIQQESDRQLSEGEEDLGLQAEQEAKISSFEEAFAKIKDATGVSDIQEVVARFLNQGETKRHLEQLREENTQQLAKLREERDELQRQFEEMKYSGEAKMSSGQRMLEEFQSHLEQAQITRGESEGEADRACRLLVQVKSGVEHLSEKLQHLKMPHTHVLRSRLDPSSEEYVLEQLAENEQKLVGLVEELSSRDLDTILKEMEDEEVRVLGLKFRHTIEVGVSSDAYRTLPKESSKTGLYEEASDSDEETTMREAMKRETQLLVESKSKKKTQDDDDDEEGKGKRRRRH